MTYIDNPKIAVIVIAVGGDLYFEMTRRVWALYENANKSIDVYFVYAGDNEGKAPQKSDLVFATVRESLVPGILQKTVLAIREVLRIKDYDFVVRTNMSTFWNFDGLVQELRAYNCSSHYSGFGPVWPGKGYQRTNGFYASGADIVMSRDVAEKVVDAKDLLNYDLPDDAALGLFITQNLKVPLIPSAKLHPLTDIPWYATDCEILTRINAGFSAGRNRFRVKNDQYSERIRIDYRVFLLLLRLVYSVGTSEISEVQREGVDGSLHMVRVS